MSILETFKNLAAITYANVSEVFTPKTLPTSFAKYEPSESRVDSPKAWWRAYYITPAMQHRMANDKALMLAENPLLRGLIARHFKAS